MKQSLNHGIVLTKFQPLRLIEKLGKKWLCEILFQADE